jgi:hypothetical protein
MGPPRDHRLTGEALTYTSDWALYIDANTGKMLLSGSY